MQVTAPAGARVGSRALSSTEPQPTWEPASRGTTPLRGPLVIAHRGASGYRPEHTVGAYQLAIRMGADFIEPDLVSTADGVLVARHENEISGTTDVASHPEFADRRTTKCVGGVTATGWFTEDFTLAELRTLRATERLPHLRPRNTWYDGRYLVPTFDEVLELAAAEGRRRGHLVGVYPETKHPSYFDSIGLSMQRPLAEALRRHGLDRPNAQVFVQSFETTNLRELDALVRVPLVQLVAASGAPFDLVAAGDPRGYDDLVTPAGLREISTYAAAIGPAKSRVIPPGPGGVLGAPTPLVDDAHAAGLLVHPYTFRHENHFLPTDLREGPWPAAAGDVRAEVTAFLDAGVDGFFADCTDLAVAARDGWLAQCSGITSQAIR